MNPVIIIFGAAVRRGGQPSGAMVDRVRTAFREGQQLEGVVYMPTGGVGRHGPAEAELMATMLRQSGVPASQIRVEPTGRNTITSVLACVRLLRGETGAQFTGPVFAATSAYHLPRCVLLLRIAGLTAHGCPPTWGPPSSSIGKRWYWRLREIPAIPVDAAMLLVLRLLGKV